MISGKFKVVAVGLALWFVLYASFIGFNADENSENTHRICGKTTCLKNTIKKKIAVLSAAGVLGVAFVSAVFVALWNEPNESDYYEAVTATMPQGAQRCFCKLSNNDFYVKSAYLWSPDKNTPRSLYIDVKFVGNLKNYRCKTAGVREFLLVSSTCLDGLKALVVKGSTKEDWLRLKSLSFKQESSCQVNYACFSNFGKLGNVDFKKPEGSFIRISCCDVQPGLDIYGKCVLLEKEISSDVTCLKLACYQFCDESMDENFLAGFKKMI